MKRGSLISNSTTYYTIDYTKVYFSMYYCSTLVGINQVLISANKVEELSYLVLLTIMVGWDAELAEISLSATFLQTMHTPQQDESTYLTNRSAHPHQHNKKTYIFEGVNSDILISPMSRYWWDTMGYGLA